MKKLLLVMLVVVMVNYANAGLIITGIVDTRIWRQGSDGSWSAIKVPTIEIYCDGACDISVLPLEYSKNGDPWAGKASTTGQSGVPDVLTDTFFYVIGTASSYSDVWGDLGGAFANVSTTEKFMNFSGGSGNDGYRVGTAQVYDDSGIVMFQHSWMYRKDGTGIGEGFEWHPEDWVFGGNDALRVNRPETEDFMYADELRAAVPFGTYEIPEPATLTLLGMGCFTLISRRKK